MVLGPIFAECFAVLCQGLLLNCIQTSTNLCCACFPKYRPPCDSDDSLDYDPLEDDEEWHASRRDSQTAHKRPSHSRARWSDQSVQTDQMPSQEQQRSRKVTPIERVIQEEPIQSKMERTPLLQSPRLTNTPGAGAGSAELRSRDLDPDS